MPDSSSVTTPQQASCVDFGTLDQRCRATGFPPPLERWLRRCWESAAAPSTNGDCAIDVALLAAPPWTTTPPGDVVETTTLDGASLSWRRNGERCWNTGDRDVGVQLTILEQHARIEAWNSAAASHPERTTPLLLSLHVAMCEALRARGFVPLHAAVIARDGRATALVGRSGVGKSTTLLSSIDAGWLPIAEDFAWLDVKSRHVYGWPGDRGVRLTADGLAHLPADRRAAPWHQRSDGKYVLAYDAIAPSRPLSAQLTRVAVLQRDASGDSRLDPLTPRDAARALWESAGVPLCRISREAFATQVPTLLTRIEWMRLTIGRAAQLP